MKLTFHSLKISDIKRETKDTVSIAFEVPTNLKEQFKFVPGQYLTLKANIGGEEVRRSYSICSALSQGELRVAVKEVEKGRFSVFANRELQVGQQLDV